MALFTPGPLAAAVSGSVGGTTFSHNRGGAYTRARKIPVNRKSPKQLAMRAYISSLASTWSLIPLDDRLSWQTWAQTHPVTNALGNAITLTALQAYIQLNARLAWAGLDTITHPPLIDPPTPLETFSITADVGAGAVSAVYTPTPLGADLSCVWDAALVESPAIHNVNNLYKRLTIGPEEGESPYDIESRVLEVFGTLNVGWTLHVRARIINRTTGLWSAPLSARALVISTEA